MACLALHTYRPHFGYPYPIHIDEWYHIAVARGLHHVDLSYFSADRFDPLYFFFHAALSTLDRWVPLVENYRFFPVINACIIGGVLYTLLSKKEGAWVALLSLGFLCTLKSNVNLMGLWFFVPMSAVISLDYLFVLKLDDWMGDKRGWRKIAALLALIGLVHPTSLLVMSSVFFAVLGFRLLAGLKFDRRTAFGVLGVGLVLVFVALFTASRNYKADSRTILEHLIWKRTWAYVAQNPIDFYGLIPSLFAFIGFFVCLGKKQWMPLCFYFGFAIINFVIFSLFEVTIFSSYQRSFYHGLIAAVPLSALGVRATFVYARQALSSRGVRHLWIWLGSLGAICALLSAVPIRLTAAPEIRMYQLTSDNDYAAMKRLASIAPPSSLLIRNQAKTGTLTEVEDADVLIERAYGNALYPIAEKIPLAGVYHYPKEGDEIAARFFKTMSCEERKAIVTRWPRLEFIYSHIFIGCEFAQLLFNNESVWIYKIVR